ncbi:MAG: MMPL family transporter [Pirellulaceae bacterium]
MNIDNQKSFSSRFPTYFMWCLLVMMPFVFFGAGMAFTRFSNDVRQWLPSGFQEARDYDWFTQYFGVDEMVVVSWPGCEIGDATLETFAESLRERRDGNGQLVFDRITTGTEILERMLKSNISEKTALKRVQGVFIGDDGLATCCLAFPSSAVSDRASVVNLVMSVASETTGLNENEIHIGGPTVDGAAIDSESKTALRNFLWMTFVVVTMLTWFRTRKLTVSLLILFFSLYCAAIGLAVLRWTGGSMNLTMIMLPTLTFILSVSGAVHMTNYYLKAYKSDPKTAEYEAKRHGVYPVIMSSLTTAVGMGSLAVSQIFPIRLFGIYSAVSVMTGLPILLIALPRSLDWLSKRMPRVFNNVNEDPGGYSTTSRMIMNTSGAVYRFRTPLFLASLALLIGLGLGVSRLKATVNVQNRFAPSTKIIQDYTWLEQQLGPLVPMEVILRIPNDHSMSPRERLELATRLEKTVRKSEFVNASYSAATFRPLFSNSRSMRATSENLAKISAWQAHLSELEKSRLIFFERNEELWRISIRIAAMKNADYGDLLDSISSEVNSYLSTENEKFAEEAGKPVSAVITGGVPMMYKAQHQVLYDLGVSFLTAFLLITVVLVFVLRGFLAGLFAMLPNVFPPLIVFGTMGWLGLPIEIGSVMTASVAMGIAVDDTIHFLAWHRRGIQSGLDDRESVIFAYKYCAKSMVDTTMICGLGVSPFMFSVFMPTVRFARLMLLLLLVGLVGDLVMLPAMLFGRVGRVFRKVAFRGVTELTPQSTEGEASKVA